MAKRAEQSRRPAFIGPCATRRLLSCERPEKWIRAASAVRDPQGSGRTPYTSSFFHLSLYCLILQCCNLLAYDSQLDLSFITLDGSLSERAFYGG